MTAAWHASPVSVRVLKRESLPESTIARELVGDDHGIGISFLLVEAEPGRGARLHKHAYEEVIVVLHGQATLNDGDEKLEVRAGDIVVIPPGQPHGFVNSGDSTLRQIDIHVNSHFATEWLTDEQ